MARQYEPPLGNVAYQAYLDSSGGKSLVSGASLPAWHEQNVRIQAAWNAAAQAVADYLDRIPR